MSLNPILNLRRAAVALAFFLLPSLLWAHDHVAAGADSVAQDAPLVFVSADDFGAETGYVFPLVLATNGPYAGYFHGELTFVALPATGDLGGPSPEAAALGSHIEAVLEAVEGPAGGSFGFWETPGGDLDADAITFSVSVGETNGTHRFPVSENDGSAGADPYGHIHGRVYSATLPGLYRVGFRFIDTSHNGTNGGPIHTPSDRFYLNFQAGLTIASIARSADGATVTYAAPTGSTYILEASAKLGPAANWTPVGDALVGDEHLHDVPIPAGSAAQFFRLRAQ